MGIETVILAILMVAGSAAYVLFPLLERDPALVDPSGLRGTSQQNRYLETLYAEKLRVLRSIRDLDFDYDLDKLIDATYHDQRIYLVRLAVAIMGRIDELEDEIATQDDELEQAVIALRTGQPEDVMPVTE